MLVDYEDSPFCRKPRAWPTDVKPGLATVLTHGGAKSTRPVGSSASDPQSKKTDKARQTLTAVGALITLLNLAG